MRWPNRSSIEVEAAALSVSGNVALQALTAASARAQIDSVEALLDDDETNLKLVQDAFEAGSANRVDVLNAQSQRANDQTLLPPLRRELSNAEHALALLVGAGAGRVDRAGLQARGIRAAGSSYRRRCPRSSRIAGPIFWPPRHSCMRPRRRWASPTANLYPQISLTATASLQSTVLHSPCSIRTAVPPG